MRELQAAAETVMGAMLSFATLREARYCVAEGSKWVTDANHRRYNCSSCVRIMPTPIRLAVINEAPVSKEQVETASFHKKKGQGDGSSETAKGVVAGKHSHCQNHTKWPTGQDAGP
jgi:hypothetical protein